VPLIYMGAYLHQGEVCATFLYATTYFLDILTLSVRHLNAIKSTVGRSFFRHLTMRYSDCNFCPVKVKLYPLKSAITKACLNKMINKYFGDVITPKCILSDNATQFRLPSRSRQLQQHGVDIRFAPIRHPESNPSERCMRELSKFCRIYCNENHRKWAELLPHIENWMNNCVCSSTGYTASELMYGTERPNVFRKMVPKESWPDQEDEGIEETIRRSYVKMKKRAMARENRCKRGNAEWNP